MKNNKKNLKGFTLVELIIVMAIFSILMAGVLSLIDPVSRIMTSANISEKTYSYVNTIQTYVEDSLKYAENLHVYTGDCIDSDNDGIISDQEVMAAAEKYRDYYFKDVVTKKQTGYTIYSRDAYAEHMLWVLNEDPDAASQADYEDKNKKEYWETDFDNFRASQPAAYQSFTNVLLNDKTNKKMKLVPDSTDNLSYATGTIKVMRLQNSNNGRISLYEYGFEADSKITYPESGVEQLNPAYWDASDSSYEFRYALGASDLVNLDKTTVTPNGAGVSNADYNWAALETDFNNTDVKSAMSCADFSITVMAVSNKRHDPFGVVNGNCLAVTRPAAVSIVNLPLMNINRRNNVSMDRPCCQIVNNKFETDANGNPVITRKTGMDSFMFNPTDPSGTYDYLDLDQDIFFVYNYTDEING